MTNLYKSIIRAKTGDLVPVFFNEKPSASRYDPKKEAASFISTVDKADFYFVLGCAATFHILELQKITNSRILVMECNDGLEFLEKNLPQMKLIDKNRVNFCTPNNMAKILQEEYLPVLYKKFTVIELHSWAAAMGDKINDIKSLLNCVLDSIKSDYVTQTHFGLQWQHNILINNQGLTKNTSCLNPRDLSLNKNHYINKITGDLNQNNLPAHLLNTRDCNNINLNTPLKHCIVVAAGSTLDKKLNFLKNHRDELFIIASDTAYRTLFRNKIHCDIALTVDPQRASIFHYLGTVDKNTIFMLDVSSSHSLATYLKNLGAKITFVSTGHPMACFVTQNNLQKTLSLNGAAGTVTMAAVDLAQKLDFKDITLIGADFSYIDGKTYCKNTYLSDIYQKSSTRLNTAMTMQVKGLYRQKIINIDNSDNSADNIIVKKCNRVTTNLLNSYKAGLFDWAHNNGYKILLNDDEYLLTNSATQPSGIKNSNMTDSNFNTHPTTNNSKQITQQIALLPFVAFLQAKDGGIQNFFDYLKQAKDDYDKYNK